MAGGWPFPLRAWISRIPSDGMGTLHRFFTNFSLRFTNSHRLFLRGMVPSTFIWFLFPKDGVMGGEEMLEIPL